MNKNVTSRQELIDTAMEIARTEGIHKVNIRNIARKCSISVGVLYNYFPNKTELIFAVVNSFWADVIQNLSGMVPQSTCFPQFVSQYYALINEQLSEFEKDWLTQLETMPPEDKKRGRELEDQCFQVLLYVLRKALHRDTSISESVWSEEYTQEEFLQFVFHHLIVLLHAGHKNCDFFEKTLRKILY